METFLLKYFLCMMVVIGLIVLVHILIWMLRELSLTWREMKGKPKEKSQQQEKRIFLPTQPALLTPKECRECMLNHIEDGHFYTISSPGAGTTIVCAQRYDAAEHRLYCHAYLWISGYAVYNLHVSDHRGIIKLRGFVGNNNPLRIDFDCNPHIIVFEDDHISPYIKDKDYNAFVQGLQQAGFDWKIEKGEDNIPGSCKYILKETITKQTT